MSKENKDFTVEFECKKYDGEVTVNDSINEFLENHQRVMNSPVFVSNNYYEEEIARINESINLVESSQFKKYLRAIAFKLCAILSKTLGPYAHTTIIDDGVAKYPTKDGWNILKRIQCNDKFFNSIIDFIRNISFELVQRVGDGTTTALVAACNFIEEFEKEQFQFRQTEFINALEHIFDIICEILHREGSFVKYVDRGGDYTDIYKIAKLSTNGNEEISRIIQEIYQKTENPNIFVSIDRGEKVSHEITSGYKYPCRVINHKIYKNENELYVLRNAAVVLFDHNLSLAYHCQLLSILSDKSQKSGFDTLIVIAPNYDPQLLEWMGMIIREAANKKTIPAMVLVQAAMSTKLSQDYANDVVKISGASTFTWEKVQHLNKLLGSKTQEEYDDAVKLALEKLSPEYADPNKLMDICMGEFTNPKLAEKYMILEMDKENNHELREHIKEVEAKYAIERRKAEAGDSMSKQYTDAYMHRSVLSGGMGVIKVGSTSDIERMCLKDSIDDAVLACRSAFEHGYARGMNISSINAFLVAIDEDDANHIYNEKVKTAIRLHVAPDTEEAAKELEERIKVWEQTPETEFKVADEKGENKTFSFRKTLSELEVKLLNMFVTVYRRTTYSIFRNKIEKDENTKMTVKDSMRVDQIIDICCTTGCTYNLLTEDFEAFDLDHISVVNPVDTDIHVLRAIIGFLTLILTSDQMLTIDKYLGMKPSKKVERETQVRERVERLAVTIEELKKKFPDMTEEQIISIAIQL